MSDAPKIVEYLNHAKMAERLRDDLRTKKIVLLFAYNGTGKTRLSKAFKDKGKRGDQRDTLYFNAYTEDLFHWDNDLTNDAEYSLRINADSRFFSGLKELSLEAKIFAYLERYADFDFTIDYEQWRITFSRGDDKNIKISRGEENIFIWCIFLAICELAIEGHQSYAWVKYLYIDDPISSLDDNNAIAVASDLCHLLKSMGETLTAVVSSHHGLFFNVMWNELKRVNIKYVTYFYYRALAEEKYSLQKTDETPFFHHVAMLSELEHAVATNQIYTHHFNVLRSIMEKTAVFFGYKDFSGCIHGLDDTVLYARALNLLSHGKYSIYQPREMVDDTRELFKQIFSSFMEKYHFEIPKLTKNTTTSAE